MSEEVETAKSLVVRLGRKQRIRYSVTPMPDALLPADSLGGQLSALSDLFAALGEKDGTKLKTLVSDISMSAEGVVTFELIIVPVARDDAALRPAEKEKGE